MLPTLSNSTLLTPRHLLLRGILGSLFFISLAGLVFYGKLGYEFLITGFLAALVIDSLVIWYQQKMMARVEKSLLESMQLNEQIINNIDEGIVVIDRDMRYLLFNPYMVRYSTVPAEFVLGKRFYEVFPFLSDQIELIRHGLEEGLSIDLPDVPFSDPEHGKAGWFSASYLPLRDLDGTIVGGIGIIRLITERKRAEIALNVAATAFETQEAMFITDANTVILRVNKAYTESTGYTADEAVGHKIDLSKSGRHDAVFLEELWESIKLTGTWQGEMWDRRKNGENYPRWLTIAAVKDATGEVTHYVGTQTDITERKAAEDEIKFLAYYDPLTRLPNRRLLLDRLQQALTASGRSGLNGALLFIDLDNFKTLNDTLGHDKGDLLLQQVASRLATCLRECDTVARLGDDEFVVMLTGFNENIKEAAAQTEYIGRKILDRLNQVYLLAEHEHYSSASIGITLFNENRSSLDDLLKQADIAMYQAKTAGRNTLRFFDPEMQLSITTRAALEKDMRQALLKNQFELFYQCQSCHDGRIIGVEVLLRWLHPVRGLISPVEFIPLAEDTGLILPIGQWVLESACDQIKLWEQNEGTRNLKISVNISAHQFHQPDFVENILQILEKKAVDPNRIKIELTESAVLQSIHEAISKMNALRQIGVSFSMDDFGTGYSSLAYLTQLPINQLKIDQSFVQNIGLKSADSVIVQTIIGMANNLGMELIAEGVETEAQREFLEQQGCQVCQGYLFGKPVPLAEFEERLKLVSEFS